MQFEDQNSLCDDAQNLQQMLGDLSLQDNNNNAQIYKSDSTIFIIDCTPQMIHPLSHQQRPQLQIIFQAYVSFMKSKIISSSADRVGLILLNVKNTNNTLNFQGINTVHDLNQPSAIRIRTACDLFQNFSTKFGFSQRRCPLHQAFWLYSQQIKDLDPKKFHLRIFLFTNQDQPHKVGDQKRGQAISHAHQLIEKNVQIELFPIKKTKESIFDMNLFYKQIVSFDPEDVNQGIFDGSSKIMDLQSRIRQKQFKKRTLNRILVNLGQDTQMGFKIYGLYSKARKPIAKKVDAATNKPLQRIVKKLNADGETLFDAQIGTYYPLGNEKVKLSKADMNSIKNIQAPGLTLMGFKPKSYIKPYYNIRASYFLYPDDQHVHGSSQFTDALINQLKIKNMVAIAKIVPRSNQELRFAALFPQQESFDEQDHFQTPPGFNMIFLPYAQDIANFVGQKTKVEPSVISTQLVHVTKLLINNLTIHNFDFRNFQNPSIQKFYSHLQGHALNERQVQERPDLLQPDYQGYAKFQDIIDLVKQTAIADLQRVKIQSDDENQNLQCHQYSQAKKQYKQQPKKRGRKKGSKMISQQSEEQQIWNTKKASQPTKRGRQKKNNISNNKMISQSSQQQYYWKPQQKSVEQIDAKKPRAKKSQKQVKQQHQSAIKEQKKEQKQNPIVGEVQSLLMEGQLNSIKVADLRAYLKNFGMDTVGKKQELIDRVLIFMSHKNSI